MLQEFISYQLLHDTDIPPRIWDEAKVGEDKAVYYVEMLWSCGEKMGRHSYQIHRNQRSNRTEYLKSSSVSDDVSRVQQDKTNGCSVSSKCELPTEIQVVESQMCIIRSMYLPNWREVRDCSLTS